MFFKLVYSFLFLKLLSFFSLDILNKLSSKKPKLDIDKAVNRELNQPGSLDYKGKGMEKKSKTQLKKDLGKRKHKGTKDKKMSGKKGGPAGRSTVKKGGKRTGNKN